MNQTHPTIEELVDYLHGALPAPRDAAIHGHVAGCSACSRAYQAEASLTELLRAQARAEERELPASVVAGIYAAIESPHRVPVWERVRAALRPIVVIPAAVACAAVLYFGASSWHVVSGATAINAAYYLNNHAALTASTPFAEDAPIPAVLTSDDTAAEQQPLDAPR
jgi:anti-sigma factor RsiW